MFDALAQQYKQNPPQPLQQIDNNVQNQDPLPTLNDNMQLVDMFPDMAEDPLSDDHFLEAIKKIENENKMLK